MNFWAGFEKQAVHRKYLEKAKYRYKPIKELDPSRPDEFWSPKIDGALTKIEMSSGKVPQLFSHRISKKTDRPISYNEKLPHIKSPASITAILEGETYASGPDGKPVAPEIVTGLLNSKPERSLESQKNLGLKTHTALFNILRYQGKDFSKQPFSVKRKVLEDIVKVNPDFTLPEIARTPKEKIRLLDRIKKGLHPQTREGLVTYDANTPGAPYSKAPFTYQHDVFVKEIFPETDIKPGRPTMAGGFSYGWEPDGPAVGRIGTGFSHKLKTDMGLNPEKYVGMVARVEARAVSRNKVLIKPSFKNWHVEKNIKEAADSSVIDRIYAQCGMKDPGMRTLYNSLIRSAKRYADTVQNLESTSKSFYQLNRGSRATVENADRDRRIAHEAFISDLRAFSRRAKEEHDIDINPLSLYLINRQLSEELGIAISKKSSR